MTKQVISINYGKAARIAIFMAFLSFLGASVLFSLIELSSFTLPADSLTWIIAFDIVWLLLVGVASVTSPGHKWRQGLVGGMIHEITYAGLLIISTGILFPLWIWPISLISGAVLGACGALLRRT